MSSEKHRFCRIERGLEEQALIRYAAPSGASIPALACEHGIKAAQLRRWVRQYQDEHDWQSPVLLAPEAHPFVPVTLVAPAEEMPPLRQSFCARLPNGIEIDLAQADAARSASLLEVLWRLRCSASTRN